MSERSNKPARRRRIWQALLGVLLIGLAVWTAWFLTSGGFNDYVRRRVIAQLEAITGGRVEIREFKWNLSELEFEAKDVTIHGLEKPDEMPPYVHADRLFLRARIISLFQREIGLRHISVEHPVVHIIVYSDGSTNQPSPRTNPQRAREVVQDIFDLSIERADVHDGVLIWNQRQVPLDFSANDVGAAMTYSAADKSYNGTLHVGKFDTKIEDYRTFASQADVEFKLLQSRLQVNALKWTSGRSHLEATGYITDFNEPKVTLNYRGTIDVGDAAGIGRIREIRSGMAEVQGEGSYSNGEFAGSGRLQLTRFDLQDGTLALRGTAANADFGFNGQKLWFSRISGHVLNGIVQGDISVRNWLNPTAPGVQRNPHLPVQQGTADLRVEAIPVAAVAQMASSRQFPLEQVHLSGATAGTVKAEWNGSLRNLKTAFDLKITSPTEAAPGNAPVEGTVRGNYHAGASSLELSQFDVRTPRAHAAGSGTLGRASGILKLAVNATSLAEFKPLIQAMSGAQPAPVDVNGSLGFEGNVSGRFNQPTIIGHLEVRDFTTFLPESAIRELAPAGANASASNNEAGKNIHWDSFTGDVRYSPTDVAVNRGVLVHSGAQIRIDASASLSKGEFEKSLPWAGRLVITGMDVAEVQSIAGYGYPVRGVLGTNLQFSGTPINPRGAGHLSLLKGNVYGQPLTADADFSLQNHELQIRNAVANGDAGKISGTGSYNTQSEAFRFDVRGTNFKLSGFPQLQIKRNRVEGIGQFQAQGSGTLSEPLINGKLTVTNLYLNGERIGDLTADAVTRGEDLHLNAVSSFQNASLSLTGNVKMRGDLPAQLDVKFDDIDLNPIIKSYMEGRITGHTTIAGGMRLVGPLRRPKDINGNITVDRFVGNLENLAIQNDGPLRATMANEQVRIERFRLVGEQTHFIEASGTADLGGTQHLNLKVAGKLSLKLLRTLSPDLTANGTSDFALDVAGTLRKPALNGRVQITDGSVSYTDLPNGLSGINGSMLFTQDRLQVERLMARTGGGDLVLGGFITYDRAITFNLTARGNDVRLRYPPGISSTADADLTLAGTLKNSLLSGEITVTKFGVSPRFDFASYLEKSKQPVQVPKTDSPINGLRFDVHVISTPELEVQTSLAKVSGDVDLRLRGTAARPSVLGRVNIVEGDVSFNGTQYHLERGDITFTNPVRIEPVLDLEASARVRDYDITLGLHGSTDKVLPTFRSDPPLPEGDIIALLALGRTREETAYTSMNSQQSQNFGQTAGGALLGQALNATVSSRVQRLFGVSRIKIDPQVGGPENNPYARLTVEQSVSNKVTITYITNLSQSAQQIVQVEYNINKNVSIVGNRDQNGVLGFDVRVRQRKK